MFFPSVLHQKLRAGPKCNLFQADLRRARQDILGDNSLLAWPNLRKAQDSLSPSSYLQPSCLKSDTSHWGLW